MNSWTRIDNRIKQHVLRMNKIKENPKEGFENETKIKAPRGR